MGWLSDLVEQATELPGMVLTAGRDIAGAAGDIVGGMGRMTEEMVKDPTFLKAAALAAMGYYFSPEIGAWVSSDGAALSAAEANQIAAGSNWVQAGVDPMVVAQTQNLAITPESMAALNAPAATALPIGSAAAAAEGAAVPLTSTIAPAAAAGTVAAAPAVTNALTAGDLAVASGAEGLAAPAATNALATGAGVTAADLAAASGAESLAAPASLSSIAPGATAADLAWMDAVSPSQMEAIGSGSLPGLSGFTLSSLASLAKDYGVPLSMLASGLMGASTARSAAQTQADAARYAADLQYKQYQEQKALQEPYRQAGLTAQNQLLTYLGLPGGTQGADYGKWNRPFGMSQFQADPGYAFRLSEGMKALEASRAAKGGLLGGATGKALTRYGQEMGSQEYGNAFNRYQVERSNALAPLGSLMTSGQAAASNQAGAAGQYGVNAGNLITGGAAAQAAGQVGMSNALTGALGQYLNYSASQDLANAIAQDRRQSLYGR